MSLDLSGMNAKLESVTVTVKVQESHLYIRLANALSWQKMGDIVLPDLQKDRCWTLGRNLMLRIHLGILILCCLLKKTARQIEEDLRYHAVYQVFCGFGTVSKWFFPDHTNIVRFRQRLSKETIAQLSAYVIQVAQLLGFVDPSWMDIDSTVHEVNASYPSDASLLVKVAAMGRKVLSYFTDGVLGKVQGIAKQMGAKVKEGVAVLGKLGRGIASGVQNLEDLVTNKFSGFVVDLKKIKSKSMEYMFLAKQTLIEKKREVFRQLFEMVQKQMGPVIAAAETLTKEQLAQLPWNVRRAAERLAGHGRKYLEDVYHFITTHSIAKGKTLAFHLEKMTCIAKGKLGKSLEFGRMFQLGRIGGNFLITALTESVRLDDKQAVSPMIELHASIFGKGVLTSVATDRGYDSAGNRKALKKAGVKEDGIQAKGGARGRRANNGERRDQELADRRSGIEPLIGHLKYNHGFSRSKMKSDKTTLVGAHLCVLGFNIRQLMRHQIGVRAAAH